MRTASTCVMVAALALLAGASAAIGATAYSFTLNQSASTLSYSFSASSPFGSSGTPAVNSTLMGANNPLLPANEQTRIKHPLNAIQCGTFAAGQNDAINVSGTIDASGSSAMPSTNHPGGTFKLSIDTAAGTCTLQNLNVNLVASGPITATANLDNFVYEPFCAINPSCSAPYLFPISLPIGDVTVPSLVAAQGAGASDSGTLTPSGANTWNFSVATTLTVTPTILLSGTPLAAAGQQVATTLSGSIVVNGNTATITATTQLNYNPPATAPGPQAPTAFTVPASSPLCAGINVILSLNLISSTITNSNTANISATGTRIACACDTNANGSLDVQDIFDYLNLWFAGSPSADFNGGGLTVQDIFDFLACWFSRPAGC
jgi:hypothetical protein